MVGQLERKPVIDLAIVGSGVLGTTAAYLALRSHQVKSVLLLDKSATVMGASAYSAGLCTPIVRSNETAKLSRCSESLLRSLRKEIPSLPVEDVSTYLLCRSSDVGFVSSLCEQGATQVEGHDLKCLVNRCPWLQVPMGETILALGQARRIRVREYVEELVARMRKFESFKFLDGVQVLSVEEGDDSLELKLEGERRISARKVLIATGPWILSGPGCEVAQREETAIKKVIALHIHEPPLSASPVIYLFEHNAFLMPMPERDCWLMSYTSSEWGGDPDTTVFRISAQERAGALRLLARYSASFVEKCMGGRAFCDAYTPNQVPFAGWLKQSNDCVVAGGSSGSGARYATGLAADALHKLYGAQLVE